MAIPLPGNSVVKFRHELKYQIDTKQLYTLKAQLPDVMMPDPHVGQQGFYRIRSLYFDDFENAFYYENENGTEPREKFRIRLYNGSTDRIRLELKRKQGGMIHKRSCRLTKELAETMVRGETIPWDDAMDPLLKKFYILQETRLLRPKMIVEYDRFPYVYPDGNVRVTLDLNICASARVEEFLEPEICGRPIMPKGSHLLEAKYDEFMPDFVFRSFQNKQLKRVTFSKYYLCRKYGDFT